MDVLRLPQQLKPILYFAYDTDMSLTHLQKHCESAQYYEPAAAVLKGYTFFSSDSTGLPNIKHVYDNRVCVYGLLYILQPEDQARLDEVKFDAGYQKTQMSIYTVVKEDEDEDEERQCLQATVYLTTDERNKISRDITAMGLSGDIIDLMDEAATTATEMGVPTWWITEYVWPEVVTWEETEDDVWVIKYEEDGEEGSEEGEEGSEEGEEDEKNGKEDDDFVD